MKDTRCEDDSGFLYRRPNVAPCNLAQASLYLIREILAYSAFDEVVYAALRDSCILPSPVDASMSRHDAIVLARLAGKLRDRLVLEQSIHDRTAAILGELVPQYTIEAPIAHVSSSDMLRRSCLAAPFRANQRRHYAHIGSCTRCGVLFDSLLNLTFARRGPREA